MPGIRSPFPQDDAHDETAINNATAEDRRILTVLRSEAMSAMSPLCGSRECSNSDEFRSFDGRETLAGATTRRILD